MKKPEVTSKRVASIAGKVLRQLDKCKGWRKVWAYSPDTDEYVVVGDVNEIQTLAASALTQSPNNPKRKP